MYVPDLIFLSEPQTFQADLPSVIDYFKGDYDAFLNSEDLLEPDLSHQANRTKGGNMIMWRKHLDPYISVHKPDSTSFLFVILDIPGHKTSIHAALYLPTAGKDLEYLAALATLKTNIEDLQREHPGAVIYLRGDANSSNNNKSRSSLLSSFCSVSS